MMGRQCTKGLLIKDKEGDFVACLGFTPTPKEISELIAAYNDLTGSNDPEDSFCLEDIPVVLS